VNNKSRVQRIAEESYSGLVRLNVVLLEPLRGLLKELKIIASSACF
jgi:hypothetical protein